MINVEAISSSALSAIADIEANLFEKPLLLSAIESLFDGPAFAGLISLEEGNICGYVLAHMTHNQLEILSIGTVRRYQRQGHANLLLGALITEARNAICFLEVAADNEAALALYRKNDFVESGRRPRYYRRGHGIEKDRVQGNCDALIMRRG